MVRDEESREMLRSIKKHIEDSEKKWDDHLAEHRARDEKMDKEIGGINKSLYTGGITMRDLKASIPIPLTLAESFKRYFFQVLGLIGALFGLWRTLATIDYVDKAVDVHSHSESAHPLIIKEIDGLKKERENDYSIYHGK